MSSFSKVTSSPKVRVELELEDHMSFAFCKYVEDAEHGVGEHPLDEGAGRRREGCPGLCQLSPVP